MNKDRLKDLNYLNDIFEKKAQSLAKQLKKINSLVETASQHLASLKFDIDFQKEQLKKIKEEEKNVSKN